MKETECEVTIDLNRLPKGVTRRSVDPWKDFDDDDVSSFLDYVGNKIKGSPTDATVVIYGIAPTEVAMKLGAFLYGMCNNVVHSREFHGRKIIFENGEVL